MKSYEWHHMIVTDDGTVIVLEYDTSEASIAWHQHGGRLYRTTPVGVFPETPMALDIAMSFHERRRAKAAASEATKPQTNGKRNHAKV